MFHLFTHAFFKAMLFLGAGSVIHAMHHEQDMRNYGGLRKKIPLTFCGDDDRHAGDHRGRHPADPLSALPGFLSKDAVIESAWVGSSYAFWLLVVAACMTIVLFLAADVHDLLRQRRAGRCTIMPHDHATHESPMVMLIPLGVLALGAVFSGMIWYNVFFGDEDKVRAWFGMPAEAHHAEAGAEHGAEGDHAAPGEAAADTATGHDTAGETVAATEAAEWPWHRHSRCDRNRRGTAGGGDPGSGRAAVRAGQPRAPRGARGAELGQGRPSSRC